MANTAIEGRNKRIRIGTVAICILAIQLGYVAYSFGRASGLASSFLDIFIGLGLILFIPGIVVVFLISMDRGKPLLDVCFISVALSVCIVPLIGLLENTVLSTMSISEPFYVGIIISVSLFNTLSLIVVYLRRGREWIEISGIIVNKFIPEIVFGILVATLTLDGGYQIRTSGAYGLDVFMIILLAAAVIYCTITGRKASYPFLIWTISAALALHWSLASNYPPISDGIFERYISELVRSNGIWKPFLADENNAELSVVLFNPMVTTFAGISLSYFYRLVLPLLASFMPIGLYVAYKKRYGCERAFLGSLLVVSCFSYFSWIVFTSKNVVGYMAFALIIYTLLGDDSHDLRNKRTIQTTLFQMIGILALITSSSALAYSFLIECLIAVIIALLYRELSGRYQGHGQKYLSTIIFSVVVTVAWYMYISNSTVSVAVINIGYRVIQEINNFQLSGLVAVSSIASSGNSPWSMRLRHYFYYVLMVFIFVGIVKALLFIRRSKQGESWAILEASVFSFTMITFLPYLGVQFSMDRIFNLSLIVLAPICVDGGAHIVSLFLKRKQRYGILLVAIVAIVFIFNETGLTSTLIFRDYYLSAALFKNDLLRDDNIHDLNYYNVHYMVNSDVVAAKWLSTDARMSLPVYSGLPESFAVIAYANRYLWPSPSTNMEYSIAIFNSYKRNLGMSHHGYVFIGAVASRTQMVVTNFNFDTLPVATVLGRLSFPGLIYSNGKTVLYDF